MEVTGYIILYGLPLFIVGILLEDKIITLEDKIIAFFKRNK